MLSPETLVSVDLPTMHFRRAPEPVIDEF